MPVILYLKILSHSSWVKLAFVYCFCFAVCPTNASMLLNVKKTILKYF